MADMISMHFWCHWDARLHWFDAGERSLTMSRAAAIPNDAKICRAELTAAASMWQSVKAGNKV